MTDETLSTNLIVGTAEGADADAESDFSCPVCLVEHDPEIHAATLRVRAWFQRQVKLGLGEVRRPVRRSSRPAVHLLRDDRLVAVARDPGAGVSGSECPTHPPAAQVLPNPQRVCRFIGALIKATPAASAT
jgi:hypothetical protein